jgi:hypothetical protein
VLASDYPAVRPLVVDNGSTDESVARVRARFPTVDLLQTGENLGYAEGNNAGLRAAVAGGASYLFVLNNDVVVARDTISLLVEALEADASIGMVGPAVFFSDPSDRLFSTGSQIDWQRATIRHTGLGRTVKDSLEPELLDVDFLVGCAVLVRRDLIEDMGGLDPAYYLNFEDVEWGVRARRRGYRVVCAPQARVWHKLSSSLGVGSPQNTYYMTRNALLFFAKNAPGVWRVLAPVQIVLRTVRTIAAWSLKRTYQNDLYRRKRAANVLALRDGFLQRFGKISADAAVACGLPR